ncbi:methyltransferase domain-containing protein [Flagellimonas allohymeniacidonis]|uniref:Methyltransferase domain-containing protein n=1 Tax=Flagellimonas allohymeniacidonis TaxID=2517819 RepID=A0A4Q8QEI7_9FLAO|nr:methyltransferase domain-containing protein [Allomuricauda hymeniacidonis]TAI48861.1 methyltransferase domain-containing protein [Allomuricauda hymeniacidonis]
MDFSLRSRVAEKMDDPNMAFEMLQEAYEDINKCNKLLGGDKITIQEVWKLIKRTKQKSYTILDMGSGDGTMLRKLSNFLTERKIEHQMTGIDLREDVLEIARKQSEEYLNITYKKMDILKADSGFECDIIINTLTMHHFEEERLETFLNQFVSLAKVGVVINDLQRSKWAYYLFKVFSFFFIRTEVAKYDGLVSISKGFTKNELIHLSNKIPSVIHTIRWRWAFRYVWVMQIKQENNI